VVAYGVERTEGSVFNVLRWGFKVAKKENRVVVVMACTECKRRNYQTQKNKQKTTERLELKKYCRFCRCQRPHRETR
jgi:large subunit ribosomal protein L33